MYEDILVSNINYLSTTQQSYRLKLGTNIVFTGNKSASVSTCTCCYHFQKTAQTENFVVLTKSNKFSYSRNLCCLHFVGCKDALRYAVHLSCMTPYKKPTKYKQFKNKRIFLRLLNCFKISSVIIFTLT